MERLSAELKQLTEEIQDQRAALSQDASHGPTWEGWRACVSMVGVGGLTNWKNMRVVSDGTLQHAAVSD